MRQNQTTIATSKRSPREQRERNTALRLAALLDACFNRPIPVVDPEWDEVNEISYELAN
jgi:hypothetical protein